MGGGACEMVGCMEGFRGVSEAVEFEGLEEGREEIVFWMGGGPNNEDRVEGG